MKKKDVKVDDSNRLKQAAAEAKADDIASPGAERLEPRERTGSMGTRDQEAEKLTGKPMV